MDINYSSTILKMSRIMFKKNNASESKKYKNWQSIHKNSNLYLINLILEQKKNLRNQDLVDTSPILWRKPNGSKRLELDLDRNKLMSFSKPLKNSVSPNNQKKSNFGERF